MKRKLFHITRRIACICLFANYALYSYSSDPGVNDSIIDACVWNAKFAEALSIIDQYKQQPVTREEKALLLLKECDIHLKLGNIGVSEELLRESKSVISTLPDQSIKLRFQFALQKGNCLLINGKHKEAYAYLKRAETLVKFIKDPYYACRIYGSLGSYFHIVGDIDHAIGYNERAAAVQNDTPYGKIMTIGFASYLSRLYRYNEEPDKANDLFTDCLNFLDTTENPMHPALLDIYINMARYYLYQLLDVSAAEVMLQKALRIVKSNYPDQHPIYCQIYYLNSRIEYSRKEIERALIYCNYSLKIADQYPFLNELRRSNFITRTQIYEWLKLDYEKVVYYANLGLKIPSVESPAYFYFMLGIAYTNLHKKKEARYNLEKVITMNSDKTSFDEQYLAVRALKDLGHLTFGQDIRQTIRYYEDALGIMKKFSFKNGNTAALNYDLSTSYVLLTQEYEKALFHVQQAIITGCKTFSDTSRFANPDWNDIYYRNTVLKSFGLKAFIFYRLYTKNEKNLQYLQEALKCQENSVRFYEKMLFVIEEENSGLDMVSTHNIVRAMNNAVSYATLLYLKTGEGVYEEKAFQYAEKSKMQRLQMSTQKESLKYIFNLPDSLITKEEQLNHEIIELENVLALLEKSGSGTSLKLLSQLTELYDRRTTLTNSMEKKYPAYFKAKFSFNVAGLKEIQQMLDEDQIILEYQLLTTEIITFVISRNDHYIHFQEIDNKFLPEIKVLRDFLSVEPLQQNDEGSFPAFIHASTYLYDKLIDPFREKIRNKRLIIIPHNEMTQIPFEILLSEEPQEKRVSNYRNLKYLIREFPIVYAYSANLLLENKNAKRKYGKGTAIFLPEYNKSALGLQPLKGAAAEAEVVRKLSHGKIFRDRMATEGSFKSRANHYRILHIASHTLLDLKNPLLSCMVMTAEDTAEDGRLYAYEIGQLKLNAQMVMLSGCNTGYGQLRRSEGLVSIARSFFYTGVRTIGYTLWPVADKAGYDLIRLFYNGLKKHQTLDVAMRNSKLAFLEEADPVKTHPYYWAGYIMVGKADKVPLRKFPLSAQIAGIALLAITLFMLTMKINRRASGKVSQP